MTHANAHAHFKREFQQLLDGDLGSASAETLSSETESRVCQPGWHLPRHSVVTMCDSGVFTKDGCTYPSYEDLFEEYRSLSVDYGVVIDYLKDKERTLESAAEAMRSYKSTGRRFGLVGVAQGQTAEQYVECYRELKRMGYRYVAVGGMLQKKEKSARYVYVRDEQLLRDTLLAIREMDPTGWLFALGCYSPQRHSIFTENSVFGSDYKGWIFEYTCRSPRKGNLKYQAIRFRQVRRFIEANVLAQTQKWGVNRRLLIVSCSRAKRPCRGRVQAINLYNGPVFALLRRHVRNFGNSDGLDLLILSARYGLITPKRKVLTYDEKMTSTRADELAAQVRRTLATTLTQKAFSEIALNLGKNYQRPVLDALSPLVSNKRIVTFEGRIGERLSQTRRWILSDP